ncbi:hypothetical protein FOA43_003974 [Brettanomyces nanus]|uniref:RRM domain-containing protein n=1 Tax=Eeniella nana TaxID=13502 RepID=A0A875S6M6_EENNA|nr:uncharacterized protein FOA43_003974 [Brettanomyces nanus]QPG76583.1 hypothetical protein FOA43_003974 [Brettanomyces nanus]
MPSNDYSSSDQINTLYVRNLNEKISREMLKNALISTFKKYGLKVLDITTFKNVRLRGQSFITLASHKDCLKAIDIMNTIIILDKPIDMHIAKVNSDRGIEELMKQADHENYKVKFEEYLRKQRSHRLQLRKSDGNSRKRVLSEVEDDVDQQQNKKARKTKTSKQPPQNKILLLTKLPSDVIEDRLFSVFDEYKGFLNLTLVGIRHLALVEFKSEDESARCLQDLDGKVTINGNVCELQFAKK